MNPIIDIEDVSFSYRETHVPALNHISLAIGEGDFLGIIGPSGAGKSTLAA
ncbi:MAG: ATP-binding cassette domain-containing protein, partial [Collinsella bouchesdurhonensis]|nr:ATP-binding cassette domain-containing protein [Collinsella bouchesdurhonensis]